MTSWQEQQDRGGSGRTALDRAAGQPTSRPAAREAERRAAEASSAGQVHPSGVVDFEGHDFSDDFAPDQDFSVGDTQDIWAALTRGSGRPPAAGTDGAEGPASPVAQDSAVSGELLDRVRDAVLRRGQEQVPTGVPEAQAAPQAPRAAAVPAEQWSGRTAAPQAPLDGGAGPTRRERRRLEAAEVRDDELPSGLFGDRGPAASPAPATPRPRSFQPAPATPAPSAAQASPVERAVPAAPAASPAYDEVDDYDDEPYAPEPTVSIPSLRPMELEQPATNPVGLPHAFAVPAGGDVLAFSSPVPVAQAEAQDADDDEYGDDGYAYGDDDGRGALPEPYRAARPQPAAPDPAASPFLEPQGFTNPQLGPPSEVTDLAGFEALIRKARQQPAPQQPQRPAPAWADDEDVHEGFTGLLSRSVQGSHGSPNALILPNDPQPADVTQAVSGTGDIFITGSLNLPRSLSTTGTTTKHESHDVDRFFDGSQDEPETGVAPVRASRAISGTGESGIVRSKRGRGTVLPTVLAVVATVMAVGVVVLLVSSWATKLF